MCSLTGGMDTRIELLALNCVRDKRMVVLLMIGGVVVSLDLVNWKEGGGREAAFQEIGVSRFGVD